MVDNGTFGSFLFHHIAAVDDRREFVGLNEKII